MKGERKQEFIVWKARLTEVELSKKCRSLTNCVEVKNDKT